MKIISHLPKQRLRRPTGLFKYITYQGKVISCRNRNDIKKIWEKREKEEEMSITILRIGLTNHFENINLVLGGRLYLEKVKK